MLKKEAAYHGDIITVNEMLVETLKERGFWETYQKSLEIDLLFIWYLATVKIICLRFEKPPYEMFCRLKRSILFYIPECLKNPYIPVYMKEFYQLLLVFAFQIHESSANVELRSCYCVTRKLQ